jgi:cyanophycinase
MRTLALLLLLAASSAAAAPVSRLVVIGGGDPPPAVTARFVEWAGGASARVLVVTWASSVAQESCEEMLAELKQHGVAEAECAPRATLDEKGVAAPLEPAARAAFLEQLGLATGVYFTGGDQARIMAVLADEALLAAVRKRHAEGIVFAGTSAGAAVMSPRMITGEGDFTVVDGSKVEVKPGLGLLPGTIVDQHFIKRQRQNRLFGLVLLNPGERGVGIDEATAIAVTGGRYAEVIGASGVMLVDAVGKDRLSVRLLRPGETVDLQQRP